MSFCLSPTPSQYHVDFISCVFVPVDLHYLYVLNIYMVCDLFPNWNVLILTRVGKSGWENRYCVLEGTWLTLYLSDADANPVDSFDLNPMDADVSVHSAVTSSELANTATSDLYHILRLDQDPMTTCWPGR